jgi:predicted dienelactone hydrolase
MSPKPAWLILLIALLLAGGSAQAQPSPPPASTGVGYQLLQMPDPAGGTVEVGVWYPVAADIPLAVTYVSAYPLQLAKDAPVRGDHLPLVVMSHGNGGDFAGHWDTAVALARAGFVAAALTHTGDNWRDQSKAVDLPERPRQLKVLVDYMLSSWSGHAAIDPGRVGAFGFSAGGFTVLALAGGEPDLSTIGPHCTAHPDVYDCQLIKRFPGAADAIARAKPVWTHDSRIRAVVSAAPAVGFAFGKAGMAGMTQPLQLWRAEQDHVLPHPDYAQAVHDALPTPPDYHVVAGADHYDFLVPCNDTMRHNAPVICASLPGFDRAAFHETFNRDVVAFFVRTLGT